MVIAALVEQVVAQQAVAAAAEVTVAVTVEAKAEATAACAAESDSTLAREQAALLLWLVMAILPRQGLHLHLLAQAASKAKAAALQSLARSQTRSSGSVCPLWRLQRVRPVAAATALAAVDRWQATRSAEAKKTALACLNRELIATSSAQGSPNRQRSHPISAADATNCQRWILLLLRSQQHRAMRRAVFAAHRRCRWQESMELRAFSHQANRWQLQSELEAQQEEASALQPISAQSQLEWRSESLARLTLTSSSTALMSGRFSGLRSHSKAEREVADGSLT